jgi:hypothetical protein
MLDIMMKIYAGITPNSSCEEASEQAENGHSAGADAAGIARSLRA